MAIGNNMTIKKIFSFVIVLSIISVTVSAQEKNSGFAFLFKNLPFKMKSFTPPVFLNKSYNIKNYGAVGDGLTLNTKAFEKAIAECSKNGRR